MDPDGLVFCTPDGNPLPPNTVTKTFRKLADSIGLHGVCFHDQRHGHATLMLRQGVHPKIVSERLGHASINITLDTYSHVLPGLQAAAAKRFEEGLCGDGFVSRATEEEGAATSA
jgi:integrase